jgi:hypothetical protein
MYTQADRRLFRRIEGKFPVNYISPGSRKKYRTTTKNISGGGTCMPIFERLAPGTILDLEIFRNGLKTSAKCKGEVRWVGNMEEKGRKKKSLEAGIKFIDLSFLYIGNLIGDIEAKTLSRV